MRLADSAGLYLEVTPAGGRYWRWKYRFAGREKRLALGTYPVVTLAKARQKRDDARGVATGRQRRLGTRRKLARYRHSA